MSDWLRDEAARAAAKSVNPAYAADTVLLRAARGYLWTDGAAYSRRGLRNALIFLGLDPDAPWIAATGDD